MKKKLSLLLLSSLLFIFVSTTFTACQLTHGLKNHQWELQEVVQEPTCTKDGIISYSCKCGETKTETIEAEGHWYGKTKIISEATCLQEGQQEKTCKTCEYTKTETIDLTDHSYVNGMCKWCKAKQNGSAETNGTNSSQNGNTETTPPNNNNDPATEGMVFSSNGDGTCFLSVVYSFEYKTVTIPSTVNGETVTGIGSGAFLTCDDLEFISIPATVTDIADYAFEYCYELFSIKVDPKNPAYCSENGILYDKAKSTLICYPPQITSSGFILPKSVTTIAGMAFSNNTYLIRLCIHSNLQNIEAFAFRSAFRLNEIYYEGSEYQWNFIYVGSSNDGVVAAEVYYNIDPDWFYNFV